ncbi:MAG: glycine hydroxymethyltransferase, partial [Verrucomicrobia bacterium]|nr:glycine hydroxymethyltransferase [Verrucomicrobiota bacterium]
NPIPYAHIVTTTTHKTLRGPRGGMVLCTKELKEAVDKGCPMVLGGPLPHVIAAKAVSFKEAGTPDFQRYAQNIVDNAQEMAEELVRLGATLFTGGTDNHLLVIDTRPYGLTGRQAEGVLREAKLTVSRNTLPQDPNGPWYTSGVRIGTPATTTLGMGKEEMRQIAKWIVKILTHTKPLHDSKGKSSAKGLCDQETLQHVQGGVLELLSRFPLYPQLDIEGTWTQPKTT